MAKLYVWGIEIGYQSYDGWTRGPDSAGSATVEWSFKNNTEKTIKYATFRFIPYNAVDDAMTCRISGRSLNGVKYTGPLAPGFIERRICFKNAWNNHSIVRAALVDVFVEYMDGTEELINLSDIAISEDPPKESYFYPEEKGCYVATAVYGSYDCPQVWTLRRYRDYTLAETWYGRLFIKIYYAISPTLVKWFGHTEWFKKMWQGKLDRMVANLQAKGVESTPYEDKIW